MNATPPALDGPETCLGASWTTPVRSSPRSPGESPTARSRSPAKRRAPPQTPSHAPRDSVSSVASALPLYHLGDPPKPKRFSLPPPYDLVGTGDPSTTKAARENDGTSDVGTSSSASTSSSLELGTVLENGPLGAPGDEDPLDVLVRRTAEILDAAQEILKTTKSSRAHFSRFLSLDDSLELALRRSVDEAGDLENGLEDVTRRVDAYADRKPEPDVDPLSAKRRQRSDEPVTPTDPRSFLSRSRAAPLARPPRLRTMYLNAESDLPTFPAVSLPFPTPPVEVSAEPEMQDGEPPATSSRLLGTLKIAGAGVLSRIMDVDSSPLQPPQPVPTVAPAPSASRLLSAIAASSPRQRAVSVSATSTPAPPALDASRRTSTSSMSPSSSSLSPPLFSSRIFSPIAEDDDDSNPVTPATSRAPSPSPSPPRKSSLPLTPPRPHLIHHARSFSIAPSPSAPQISLPSTLSTKASMSTLGPGSSTPTTSRNHPPPSPSAMKQTGEDTTKVHARGDLGHRRTASGLKERLEAMRAGREEATSPSAGDSNAPAGWWGSWRGAG